jgi:SAM-dependent methyltransferase
VTSVYGKDFAAVYHDHFDSWCPLMWPFLRKTVKRLRPDASTWLDLCCGGGSLLKLACESGFSAVGVDSSRHQLRFARRNAPAAKLVHGDVRKLDLSRSFDVVTCMFDSLNYLTTRRDLTRAFRTARRHLATGGLLIFDMNTFEGMQDRWSETMAFHQGDRTVVAESTFDERRALGRCVITGFIKDGRRYKRFREIHVERGYRAEEIDCSLEDAGLSFRRYDASSFARPGRRTARLIYVCRAR